MELIKSNDSNYEEYENLLLERDQLLKEAGSIWTSYIKTFGQLMTDVYEEKLACIQCKKTIAYYQQAINHGRPVDPDALQRYLDQEMAAYYANLRRMQADNDACRDAKRSTSYEVQRAKTLYRRLAKLLHPDINPQTDREPVLQDLWQRIQAAYGLNDIKELSELEVLTRRALKDLGLGAVRVDIPDLADRIAALRQEIDEILHTEPYIYSDLLADPDAVSKKKAELQEELASYQQYHRDLEKAIQDLIVNGGIQFLWQMK